MVAQERLEAQIKERTKDIEEVNRALERSVKQLDLHQQEMVLLGETGNLFQACHDLDEAVVVAEMQLRRLFPDLSVALFLMNPSRNTLQKVAGWGQSIPKDQCHAPEDCWALRRSKPHFVGRKEHGIACHCMLPVERSWYVCLPLIAGGEALGSLWLAAPGTPGETAENGGEIDGDRMDFYVAVAETLSFAIANLRLRETLRYQALRDPLTGLFNRRYLLDVVDHELQRAASRNQELSVVMFDIDHFKRLNDAFGHAAGDTVLARLGALLREWVRADDIAVRYGGEEFTIVLPDTSSELAVARAESLRQAIASLSVEHDGQPLAQVTISAGIATFPVHGIDREALIQSADQALYASKRAGRNRVSLAPLPVAEQSQISVAV